MVETLAPDNLHTMPLHEITERFGQQGLERRLAIEIADFPEEDRTQIEDGLRVAKELHGGDMRATGEPYMNHILRVTTRILSHYGVRDRDVTIAALLHDTVEDHPRELADLGEDEGTDEEAVAAALQAIERMFNPEVSGLVAALTTPERPPDKSKPDHFRDHILTKIAPVPRARVIKTSDFTDNGVGIHYSPPNKAESVAPKYLLAIPIFRAFTVWPDTPLSPDVRNHILRQLDLGEQRMRAVIQAAAPFS